MSRVVQVFHMDKSVNVQAAKAKKWRVQWCGVGTIGGSSGASDLQSAFPGTASKRA